MIPVIALVCSLCLAGYLILVLVATRSFLCIPSDLAPDPNRLPTITVLIPARNEASRIRSCLDALIRQDYPPGHWDLLVINDHSTDATAEVVQDWISKHLAGQGKVLLSSGRGKKEAIETGVRAASGEWILQTDADCVPGPGWIRSMAGYMKPKARLVSGPIRLLPGSSWLERLQALEMAGLVTLGAGSLHAGFPNMANGANIAYRTSTFLRLGGFESSRHIASGDDEFLVQAIHQAFPGSLAFAKSTGAVVDTQPQPDWQGFVRQRTRWVSKAKGYIQRSTNVIQLISYLGFWSFPIWSIAGISDPAWLWAVPALFLFKTLIDYRLMSAGTSFLQKPEWLRWLLLLEVAYIPYVIWIGIKGNLSRSYLWKDREVT